MPELIEEIRANLEIVLRDVCVSPPGGGDHEVRKLIANRLLDAVGCGTFDLRDLRAVALRALMEAKNKGPATFA